MGDEVGETNISLAKRLADTAGPHQTCGLVGFLQTGWLFASDAGWRLLRAPALITPDQHHFESDSGKQRPPVDVVLLCQHPPRHLRALGTGRVPPLRRFGPFLCERAADSLVPTARSRLRLACKQWILHKPRDSSRIDSSRLGPEVQDAWRLFHLSPHITAGEGSWTILGEPMMVVPVTRQRFVSGTPYSRHASWRSWIARSRTGVHGSRRSSRCTSPDHGMPCLRGRVRSDEFAQARQRSGRGDIGSH